MNGRKLVKLKETVGGMNAAEWRGYLAAKVEDLVEEQAVMKKDIKDVKTCVGEVNATVAKMPTHCIQVEKIQEIDKKVDILNEDKAGRKAVSKAIWGGSGFIGFLGLSFMLLKIFGVF